MCQFILTAWQNTRFLAGNAIVTLYMAYSMSIGRDCVHSAHFDTRSKDHKPKCCLSVTIHLLRERDILETK